MRSRLVFTTSMPTPRPDRSVTSAAVEKPGSRINASTSRAPSRARSSLVRSPCWSCAWRGFSSGSKPPAVVAHLDIDLSAQVSSGVQGDAARGARPARSRLPPATLHAVVAAIADEMGQRVGHRLQDGLIQLHLGELTIPVRSAYPSCFARVADHASEAAADCRPAASASAGRLPAVPPVTASETLDDPGGVQASAACGRSRKAWLRTSTNSPVSVMRRWTRPTGMRMLSAASAGRCGNPGAPGASATGGTGAAGRGDGSSEEAGSRRTMSASGKPSASRNGPGARGAETMARYHIGAAGSPTARSALATSRAALSKAPVACTRWMTTNGLIPYLRRHSAKSTLRPYRNACPAGRSASGTSVSANAGAAATAPRWLIAGRLPAPDPHPPLAGERRGERERTQTVHRATLTSASFAEFHARREVPGYGRPRRGGRRSSRRKESRFPTANDREPSPWAWASSLNRPTPEEACSALDGVNRAKKAIDAVAGGVVLVLLPSRATAGRRQCWLDAPWLR